MGGACIVIVVIENGHSNLSSNPVGISYSTNNLGKGMNPIIYPLAMGYSPVTLIISKVD